MAGVNGNNYRSGKTKNRIEEKIIGTEISGASVSGSFLTGAAASGMEGARGPAAAGRYRDPAAGTADIPSGGEEADIQKMREGLMLKADTGQFFGEIRMEKEFGEANLGIDRSSTVHSWRMDDRSAEEKAQAPSRSKKLAHYKRQAAAEEEGRKSKKAKQEKRRRSGSRLGSGGNKEQTVPAGHVSFDTQKKQREEADPDFATTGGRNSCRSVSGNIGAAQEGGRPAASAVKEAASGAVQNVQAAVRDGRMAAETLPDAVPGEKPQTGAQLQAAICAEEALLGVHVQAETLLPRTGIKIAGMVRREAASAASVKKELALQDILSDGSMQEAQETDAVPGSAEDVRMDCGSSGQEPRMRVADGIIRDGSPADGTEYPQAQQQEAGRGAEEALHFTAGRNHVLKVEKAAAGKNSVLEKTAAACRHDIHPEYNAAEKNHVSASSGILETEKNHVSASDSILEADKVPAADSRKEKKDAARPAGRDGSPDTDQLPAGPDKKVHTGISDSAEGMTQPDPDIMDAARKNGILMETAFAGNAQGGSFADGSPAAGNIPECRSGQAEKKAAVGTAHAKEDVCPAGQTFLEERLGIAEPAGKAVQQPGVLDEREKADKNGILGAGREAGEQEGDLLSELAEKSGITDQEGILPEQGPEKRGMERGTGSGRRKRHRKNKNFLKGAVSREKQILHAKQRYAVKVLAEPESESMDTGFGALAARAAWERAGKPVTGLFTKPLRAAGAKV